MVYPPKSGHPSRY